MSRRNKTKSSPGYYFLFKFLAAFVLAGVVAVAVISAIHNIDHFTDGVEYPSLAETILLVFSILAVIYIGFNFSVSKPGTKVSACAGTGKRSSRNGKM